MTETESDRKYDEAKANADSRRKARRWRRRMRRGRLPTMDAYIPRRPYGDAKIALKSGMMRHHHMSPRFWGSKNTRWEQSGWQKRNSGLIDWRIG